jgi:tight adherence protein B
MIVRDAPKPIQQEFAHLLREYEYGVPLDEAMNSAGERIGSNDFRLLFAALRTHRERGGNLGETLDRIAESIREIQRLERRVETLTAQGRATARWLGAMPMAVLAISYLIVPEGVRQLFTTATGNWILTAVVILNILGWLWIRKIMAVDI